MISVITASKSDRPHGEKARAMNMIAELSSIESEKHHHMPDDFSRWRPRYHVMSPSNWMNDPCAPGYNPRTKMYHLAFQWNPKGSQWGNMSWGSAVSSDMLRWDVSKTPAMKPEADIDTCGVFTGCVRATNPRGVEDGQLTCFYTSANSSPIHWTLPYQRGSERIHMATSDDDGRSWNRVPENPIVAGAPAGVNVTGWRDPFVDRWEAMDEALKLPPGHLYALVSGGIRGESPTTFLYRVDAGALHEWEYVGPLLLPGLNFSPSRWATDFGTNWEVSNFLSFPDSHRTRNNTQDFLILSVEGGRSTPENRLKSELRATHVQMWMCGAIKAQDHGAQMEYSYGGMLDHGCLYAANSFWDPVVEEHVAFGWLLEDDLPGDLQVRQGWSGCLSIPRIVKVWTWTAVTGTLGSPLSTIGSVCALPDLSGTYTVQTLSATPDPRLRRLRGQKTSLGASRSVVFVGGCSQWELDASFAVTSTTRRVGVVISHSTTTAPASEQRETAIFFDPRTETFLVDRSKSTKIPEINVSLESAPHTLFTFADGRVEPLQIRIFCDASVLEIFVNERTVISTRIYAESGTCHRIEPLMEMEKAPTAGERPGSCGTGTTRLIGFDVWPLSLDPCGRSEADGDGTK